MPGAFQLPELVARVNANAKHARSIAGSASSEQT